MYDDTEAQILDFHRSMIVDTARMSTYLRAVMATVKPGDVVLDIGCGTGVLSFFACMAGAARVYAIEQSPVIELAQELSIRNGFDDRVVFMNEWSTSVELPEPADVLVTETIGNAAVDEGILGWVIDARDRLLRPGGAIIPERLRVWTAATESWDDHALVDDWRSPAFTLDMSAAHERAMATLWWVDLAAKSLITDPGLVAEIELGTVEDSSVSGSGVMTSSRRGTIHGLASWFDAEPSSGIRVSNAPPAAAPSWSQAFLPIEKRLAASVGDRFAWSVEAAANGGKWRWELEPVQSETIVKSESTGRPADADAR
jgi:SAM-dependent methyltransferase